MDVSKREKVHKNLLKLLKYAKELTNETTVAVRLRLTELTTQYENFRTIQQQIIDRTGIAEIENQEHQGEIIEQTFYTAAELLNCYIENNVKKSEVKCDVNNDNKTMEKLLSKQEIYKCIIEKIDLYAKTSAMNDLEGAIISQQQYLNTIFHQYEELTVQLISNGEDFDACMNQQTIVHSLYTSAAAGLYTASQRFIQVQNIHAPVNEMKVKPLEINKFNGSADQWESFHDSFYRGFHIRSDMSNIQKLQHLKSYLCGEAEQLLRNFTLTDVNYSAAWELLICRYNNPKYLLNVHLKNLCMQPKCTESSKDLRSLMNQTSSSLRALLNLGRAADKWDDWVVFMAVERLDGESRKLWEQSQSTSDELPTWCQLETFLQGRIRTLDAVSQFETGNKSTSHQHKSNVNSHQSTIGNRSTQLMCTDCGLAHSIRTCPVFNQRSTLARRSIIKQKQLCYNCLGDGHTALSCLSRGRCFECQKLHHTLLHLKNYQTSTTAKSTNSYPTTTTSMYQQIQKPQKQERTVLLATALVHVKTPNGNIIPLRAVLDQGSQASFITTGAANSLSLKRTKIFTTVEGVGTTLTSIAKSAVEFQIYCHSNHSINIDINALVLKSITTINSLKTSCNRKWPHLNGLVLADPYYYQQGDVDILLGADVYNNLLLDGLKRGPPGTPTAQNTTLGWILSGEIFNKSNNNCLSLSTRVSSLNCNILDHQLKMFWEIEEISTSEF